MKLEPEEIKVVEAILYRCQRPPKAAYVRLDPFYSGVITLWYIAAEENAISYPKEGFIPATQYAIQQWLLAEKRAGRKYYTKDAIWTSEWKHIHVRNLTVEEQVELRLEYETDTGRKEDNLGRLGMV